MESRGLTTAAESTAFASLKRWAVRFRDQAVTFYQQLRRVNRNREHPEIFLSDPLSSTMIINLYATFVIANLQKNVRKV